MRPRIPFIAALGLLGTGALLTGVGALDNSVTLESARQVWADVLRDADQIGLQVTRLTDSEEQDLGAEAAAQLALWVPEDPRDSEYVAKVAGPLLNYRRRVGIVYRFHVIESPVVNAFAVPGGQIYVTRGLMNAVASEAELASVLGHEIAHVDLRHSVERFQYERKLSGLGLHATGALVHAARNVAAAGFSQDQETEADAEGLRLAASAGYDPNAASAFFARLAGERHSVQGAVTPPEEVAQAMDKALADYSRTHPDPGDRSARLRQLAQLWRRSAVYVGVRNLTERTPRVIAEYPDEYRPAR